jgi:hypothetical protein
MLADASRSLFQEKYNICSAMYRYSSGKSLPDQYLVHVMYRSAFTTILQQHSQAQVPAINSQ